MNKKKSTAPVYQKVYELTGKGYEYIGGYKNKAFYLDGKYHREDGPAVVRADGIQLWYLNGEGYTVKKHKEEMKKRQSTAPVYKKVTKLTRKGYEFHIDTYGTKHWYLDGEFHREGGPAIEYNSGSKDYYKNGKLHREDGPAYERANGTKWWFLNGKPYTEEEHKEQMKQKSDAPIYRKVSNLSGVGYELLIGAGDKYWCFNGKKHREDGPAYEGENGTKEWCLNGRYHREDGPAVEGLDGYKAWYLNGELHREDGPAIERADGTKRYFLKGYELSEFDYIDNKLKEKINNKLKENEPMPAEEMITVEMITVGPRKKVKPYTSEVSRITINPKDPTDTSKSVTEVAIETTDEGKQLWIKQQIGEILIDTESWPLIRDAVEKLILKL